MYNKNYISVGIDVGSAFKFMTIVAPDSSVIQKPFKITHSKPDSRKKVVSAIKKVEELHSLESHIFLESTGLYHFPLLCYLVDCVFHIFIINPIITHSTKNASIKKIKKMIKLIPSVSQSWDYPVISLNLSSQQSWSLRFAPLHAHR